MAWVPELLVVHFLTLGHALLHQHHHLHHIGHWIQVTSAKRPAFRVLVGTVLPCASQSKLALDLRVDEDALIAVCAGGEELAVLFRMDEWTVFIRVETVWPVLAPDLLLLDLS